MSIVGPPTEGVGTPPEPEYSAEIVATDPLYAWSVEVRRWNTYGDQVQSRTPAVIHASTKAEVTTKVRAAFGATYDSFRKLWSHDWVLNDMREISTPLGSPRPGGTV